VGISTDDGCELILDAGTGIRELGVALAGRCRHVHVLLTHLHFDHIQGLMFFAPLFDPAAEVTVWGPPAAGRALRERLARFISNPLCPVEIRELPARVHFKDTPSSPWRLDGLEIKASLVAHRGPTLGYRVTDETGSLCYLPDHEPGLGQDLATATPGWISGHALASGASLLIHDCQYADAEYGPHRGWGHSRLSDALVFAKRADAARTVLFHHAPEHDDVRLDEIASEAASRWADGGNGGAIEMAREGRVIELHA